MGGAPSVEQRRAAPTTHSPADQNQPGPAASRCRCVVGTTNARVGGTVQRNVQPQSKSEKKLRIDFASCLPLRASQEANMDDIEQQKERADLISRMFALLTAKFEDAAGFAADCQGPHSAEHLVNRVVALESLIEEALTLFSAAAALARKT
jgi:hypothetical protein